MTEKNRDRERTNYGSYKRDLMWWETLNLKASSKPKGNLNNVDMLLLFTKSTNFIVLATTALYNFFNPLNSWSSSLPIVPPVNFVLVLLITSLSNLLEAFIKFLASLDIIRKGQNCGGLFFTRKIPASRHWTQTRKQLSCVKCLVTASDLGVKSFISYYPFHVLSFPKAYGMFFKLQWMVVF